ncbi:TPA: hypothetical protein ACLFOW_002439 [Yersinia enterocolitica]|uniref:hypothetical protein n=1 Tax=Yersinia enterocolitica TaxID=630 RepID=UPI0021E7143B|nr:hypothetical protein [Yersinia enterocolitica]EKN4035313.1 hypothetical protein [Yersinia enterocolitica]EKN4156681.1 hypothetical protein [Yersinia enterocolitica]EKN4745508.1 hypothetical protein [Yersinia enterocolitica]EKN4803187.1 hypothetical protein [Yersinia enterocolitica]EKN4845912.1 hypothetical protein [Yersinia enterocolitica]
MKPVDKIELTLSRIQFIAEVSQVAQCSNSEFLVAMSLISDLTSQIVASQNYDEIFYNADGKKSH